MLFFGRRASRRRPMLATCICLAICLLPFPTSCAFLCPRMHNFGVRPARGARIVGVILASIAILLSPRSPAPAHLATVSQSVNTSSTIPWLLTCCFYAHRPCENRRRSLSNPSANPFVAIIAPKGGRIISRCCSAVLFGSGEKL